MSDITAVMVTVDRSPAPGYLAETLENLKRAGLRTSERLAGLTIVDSGPSASTDWVCETVDEVGLTGDVAILGRDEHISANRNVASALREGAACGTEWVLFLEDDIDVVARFFDAAGAWLDEYACADVPLYPLGASYAWVMDKCLDGWLSAEYPLDLFYGTQAVVMRATDADDLATWLEAHAEDPVVQTLPNGERRTVVGSGYDLLMKRWVGERYPQTDALITPCPSLVQHIGMTSSLIPDRRVHTFQSWPGRDWIYPRLVGRKTA